MHGLEGVKVLELGTMVSAAYATKVMADLGADVIKVEEPQGDPARQRGPFPGGVVDPEKSGLFLYLNTNKRGVAVDHSTLNRWVIKYAPEFEKAFRRRQCPVGRSWRMDETYVKIKGKGAYLYRAVDKEGHTIDFLLTPTRDRDAAEAFLHKAIRTQGLPEKITIDKSGANTAAIKRYNKTQKTAIAIRQCKY